MADRILADPSRRKLFEKENLYNLLEMPSRCNRSPQNNDKPGSALRTTDDSNSEEEGVIKKTKEKALKKLKVLKATKKAIRKDHRYK